MCYRHRCNGNVGVTATTEINEASVTRKRSAPSSEARDPAQMRELVHGKQHYFKELAENTVDLFGEPPSPLYIIYDPKLLEYIKSSRRLGFHLLEHLCL